MSPRAPRGSLSSPGKDRESFTIPEDAPAESGDVRPRNPGVGTRARAYTTGAPLPPDHPDYALEAPPEAPPRRHSSVMASSTSGGDFKKSPRRLSAPTAGSVPKAKAVVAAAASPSLFDWLFGAKPKDPSTAAPAEEPAAHEVWKAHEAADVLSEYAYHAAAEAAEAEAEADAAEAAALTEGTDAARELATHARERASDRRSVADEAEEAAAVAREEAAAATKVQSAMRGRATRSAMAKWRQEADAELEEEFKRQNSDVVARAEALLKRVSSRERAAVALQSAERGRRVRSPTKGMETDLSAYAAMTQEAFARASAETGVQVAGRSATLSRASIDQTRFSKRTGGLAATAPTERRSMASALLQSAWRLHRDAPVRRQVARFVAMAEEDERPELLLELQNRALTTPRLAFAHPEGLGYGAFLAEVNQIMRDEARSSAVMEELTAEYIRLSVRASVTSARGSMASAAEEADEETLAEQEAAATAAAVAQAEALVRQASGRVPRLSAEMGASQDEMPRGGTEPSGFNLALPAAGTAVRRGSDTTAPSGVVFTEDDELVGGGSLPPFLPSEAFTGGRAGYLFKRGPLGVGYYRDSTLLSGGLYDPEGERVLVDEFRKLSPSIRKGLSRGLSKAGTLRSMGRSTHSSGFGTPRSLFSPRSMYSGQSYGSMRNLAQSAPAAMMRRPSVPALRLHRLAALPMGVDFLEDAKGKDYKAFSRICREQHWRRCPRCGGAVEHREDDGSAKCLACTLRFRWAEADLYAKAVTLEQLLLEFKWQSLEKQHRHVEKVRRASAPPANYAGVAAAEDAAAEAAARAGKSRRVSAREVAQRYLGNGQLPPCSKSAWLKLQLWRAAATVPVLVALPVLTNRANKEARVAEIEHESLEWLGIAEPSQETPNAVELDTGIHHGSAMRDAGADGAARGAAALHRAVSGPAIKRDVVPIRITAPGGEVTPRSAAAMPRPPPRAPSSFGTEQRARRRRPSRSARG